MVDCKLLLYYSTFRIESVIEGFFLNCFNDRCVNCICFLLRYGNNIFSNFKFVLEVDTAPFIFCELSNSKFDYQ